RSAFRDDCAFCRRSFAPPRGVWRRGTQPRRFCTRSTGFLSQTQQSVCELHASGQRIGSQNHAGNHATVELPKSNGTEPQGYRSSTQSGPAWPDGVLWAVLSVSDVSGPQTLRQNVGRLGDEEVKTFKSPKDTGEPLPRKHRGKASRSVRALAEGGGWQARL